MQKFHIGGINFSGIVDFTNILPEGKHVYPFNPSVAHWKDDLYLCCYRIFSRGKEARDRDIVHPEQDPNHPWMSRWKIKGTDGTRFVLLKISKKGGEIKLQHEYSIMYAADKKDNEPLSFLDGAVDSRLLHISHNKFILSFNVWRPEEKVGNRIREAGFNINAVIVEAHETHLYLNHATRVCDKISERHEKNWSFWIRRNQGFFSYNIGPKHTVYETQIHNNQLTCYPINNPNKFTEKIGYFGLLEKCYNSNVPGDDNIFHVSVTTPAVLKKNTTNYLGVGHVKMNVKQIGLLPPSSSLAKFYANLDENYVRHWAYDYFMFIYEFDGETMDILRISNFFLVSGDPGFLLCFPSGLEYLHGTDKLMIFFGDHDSLTKMMIMSEHDIENSLSVPVFDRDPDMYLYKKLDACSLLPGPDFVVIHQNDLMDIFED